MNTFPSVWSQYSIFFSAEFTQKFLKKCYNKQALEDAETKSYENCYRFIYFLEHSKTYYEQANNAPLSIKPILLFYGFINLIKACILTVDPMYPSNSQVLAHGVSTRKRKKQQYCFFTDEVKIQKTGLFPFMSEKLFNILYFEIDKVKMEDLFIHTPELVDLFEKMYGRKTFLPIKREGNKFLIPAKILDYFHMNADRFKDFYEIQAKKSVQLEIIDKQYLQLLLEEDTNSLTPLKYNCINQKYYLSTNKDNFFSLPEMLNHYLLLYNLSMIARYEIEWWSDLLKTTPTHDFVFIEAFLTKSAEKGPILVYNFLDQLI